MGSSVLEKPVPSDEKVHPCLGANSLVSFGFRW